jgi:LAO/AO transport system kinase
MSQPEFNTELLTTGVLSGERRALAKVITLLEGARPDQKRAARQILTNLASHSGRSIRVGITGTPGVGKSTFIETLGKKLLAKGHKLAVLAIDPSSPLSGGSILGDRVRMEELSSDPRVFIRPSPTSGTLGGAARHTRETIVACEAAGYDVILIESVGVGQSETALASMTDVFVILQMPNAGDEIQGIKKGILELADLVVVTKADGAHIPAAKLAQEQLEKSISVARERTSFQPAVLLVSSIDGTGFDELMNALSSFIQHQRDTGEFLKKRRRQNIDWYRSELVALITERMFSSPRTQNLIQKIGLNVSSGQILGSSAAIDVLDQIFPES